MTTPKWRSSAFARIGLRDGTQTHRRLCSVEKANVLETSELWREVVVRLGNEFPDVELSHMYVDNAAMQLVRAPRQFDVIVTSNLSATSCPTRRPCSPVPSACCRRHRWTPRARACTSRSTLGAGHRRKGIANPLATILSVAMMLRYTLNEAAARRTNRSGSRAGAGRWLAHGGHLV